MGLTIFRLGYCYGLQTQENSQDRKGTGSGTGIFAVIHQAVTTGPQVELLIQARKHPVSITSGLNQPPQLQTLCSAGSSMCAGRTYRTFWCGDVGTMCSEKTQCAWRWQPLENPRETSLGMGMGSGCGEGIVDHSWTGSSCYTALVTSAECME